MYPIQSAGKNCSKLRHVEGSLTKHQFGFLPNRSTLQQLLTITKAQLYWYRWQAMVMDEGILVATIPVCQNWWLCQPFARCSQEYHRVVYWDPCILSSSSTVFQVWKPFIFADDTKCLIAVRFTTDTDKLHEDINNATDWSHFTRLLFMVAKFSHIRFLPKPSFNPDTSIYSVNGILLKQHYNTKI